MIIKTCGLREHENINAISQLEIDWMGFIFYPKSKRFIGEEPTLSHFLSSEQGQKIPQKRVGVFVNATHDQLFKAVEEYQLDYVQLHGAEGPMYCEALQSHWAMTGIRPAQLIRAFRVSEAFDFGITIDYEPYCSHFIFDTKGQLPGGNGHQFNWEILERYQGETPFLLSGGIGPNDVAAIHKLKYSALAGIDVNSKFEIEPAMKNVDLLTQFVKEFRTTENKINQ